MSLSILGEFGKILLAFSPYAFTYFLRILRICLNTFKVLGDVFVYRKQSELRHIIHERFNTFSVFPEYG